MESHRYKRVRGLITLTRLAQLVERTPFKRVVVGSSPTSGVMRHRKSSPPRGVSWVILNELYWVWAVLWVGLVWKWRNIFPNDGVVLTGY